MKIRRRVHLGEVMTSNVSDEDFNADNDLDDNN
jgi:hypothetical protein